MNRLLTIGLLFFFACPLMKSQALVTKHAPLPCLNKQFTIVAHIVRDSFGSPGLSEETLVSIMTGVNQRFEPICASFKICAFNYIDNFQYDVLDNGEWSELQTKYHKNNRINIFFVEDIRSTTACGFASLGGVGLMQNGGIVIKKGECTGSSVISHELGHFFGLYHTFEGSGNELVDGSNCETAGDRVCDTPADPYVENAPVEDYVDVSLGCRFIYTGLDANGEFYRPDVGNIMSYYPSSCNCGFTYGQYTRMAETYLNSNPKMW